MRDHIRQEEHAYLDLLRVGVNPFDIYNDASEEDLEDMLGALEDFTAELTLRMTKKRIKQIMIMKGQEVGLRRRIIPIYKDNHIKLDELDTDDGYFSIENLINL